MKSSNDISSLVNRRFMDNSHNFITEFLHDSLICITTLKMQRLCEVISEFATKSQSKQSL